MDLRDDPKFVDPVGKSGCCTAATVLQLPDSNSGAGFSSSEDIFTSSLVLYLFYKA